MFICLNMAMSADGKITSAAREPPRFTSQADRQHMDALRATADAVLMGAQTLRDDDPHFIVRDAQIMAQRRHTTGRQEQPWSIVLSRGAHVPLNRRFFTDASPRRLLITTQAASETAVNKLQKHCEVWRVGRYQVSIAALIGRLHAAGVRRLLIEGGGEVAWQFLAAQAVDELYLTLAPCLLGGRSAPTPVGGMGWAMHERCQLQLREARIVGDEIFCRYGFAAIAPGVAAAKTRHR